METRKGSVVLTAFGRGVLVDHQTYAGEWLVRLDSGSVFDTSHGRWIPEAEIAPTGGFRPDALVWWAGVVVPASETL